MITDALKWWVDGLAAAGLSLAGRIRRPRRFRLAGTGWPFVLEPLDGPRNDAAGSVEIPESMSAELLSQVRQRTRGSVFEISVPAAALLERELDPLPKESEPYVQSVVQHQIETIFPWNAKDILYTTQVKDRRDGRIHVTVRATSRSAIELALSIARACEASEVVVLDSATSGEARNRPAVAVPLGKEASEKLDRARAVAQYALVVLLVTGLCAIAWTGFMRWSSASELAILDRALSDRRALLQQASLQRGGTGRGELEARRLQGPIAVLVIERLSELLPDDTYVTGLNLDGERLRISGVSGQVAELVPLLEKSGHFRSASFYAPTTRMAGKATDRFSIEAVVHSQAKAKQ